MKPVLLVTGASRGIGAATALLAARQGWVVAVNYSQNAAAAEAIVKHHAKRHVDGYFALGYAGFDGRPSSTNANCFCFCRANL